MADGRRIENRFLVISRGGQSEIWKGDEEAHADIGHVTKTAIFLANSRWQTAAILKIALPEYLSREL